MSEGDKPRVDRGGPAKFVVDYQAEDLGREAAVGCPRCGRNIGGVRRGGAEELLCESCGILYDVRWSGGAALVRELRRVLIVEETGLPTPGQMLMRRPTEVDIGWKRRILMVVWAMLMAGLMFAGVWAVVRFVG